MKLKASAKKTPSSISTRLQDSLCSHTYQWLTYIWHDTTFVFQGVIHTQQWKLCSFLRVACSAEIGPPCCTWLESKLQVAGSFAGYKNYLHSVFFKITQKRLQIKHKVWGIEKKTVVVLVACCMFSQVYTFDLGAELKGISFSSVRMQRYSPITAIRAIQTVLTSHHVNVAGKWEL